MYTIRAPKAVGVFYNSDRNGLEREIEKSFSRRGGPGEPEEKKIVAAITPHDKYHLCGTVCAWTFSKMPRANYVILGANHLDIGSRFAIMKEGLWKTPLGEVVVSNRVAQKIIDKSGIVDYDVRSHENEHSIEVQLPFLQHRFGSDFKIVPIAIKNVFEDEDFVIQCKKVGKAVAQSLIGEDEKWVIIATTDMSHGTKKSVQKSDKKIMDSVKNLSEKRFFEEVHKNSSYVCGYGAVLTALSAAKNLKAKRSKVLKHATSEGATQDPKSVTGYSSIIIY